MLEGVDAGELVQKLKLTIPVTNLNLITQLCHLLETLLLDSGHYTDPNVSKCYVCAYRLPCYTANDKLTGKRQLMRRCMCRHVSVSV